jgi:type IV secretory pathway VirB6-like protein
MAFTGGDSDDNLFGFARLLLFTSIAYSMIAFYESPIPGVGVSFSNLLTDQAHYFATILDARSLEDVFTHLDELWAKFVQPDPWSMLATLQYWALLIVLALAKTATLAVVAFALIASAVCALVGPIFVPFILIQPLDWMFWGWFKSFAQYSFMPVIAFAYLRIGERFIYQYLLYCMQAIVVIATFVVGIFLIPSLTSSIFSGHAGQSVLPDRLVLRR